MSKHFMCKNERDLANIKRLLNLILFFQARFYEINKTDFLFFPTIYNNIQNQKPFVIIQIHSSR